MTNVNLFNPPLNSKAGNKVRWGNLSGSSTCLAIVNATKAQSSLSVVITADTSAALKLEQELRFYSHNLEVIHFPDWETLPYDSFSPHEDIISDRLATLHKLQQLKTGILVVPVATLMHQLAPKSYLNTNSLQISIGEQFDISSMRTRLENSGYRCVDTVYEHGEFALRGSIMDIYPMGSKHPYRIDLLGDEVDTLRLFDSETQRTIEQVDSISLLPGKEFPLDKAAISRFRDQWHNQFNVDHKLCSTYQDVSQGIAPAGIEYYLPLFFEQTNTLFDYLPSDTQFFNFDGLEAAADHFWQDVHKRHEDLNIDPRRPLLAPQKLFIATEALFAKFKHFPRTVILNSHIEDKPGQINFVTEKQPSVVIDHKADTPLYKLQSAIKAQPSRVLICAESAGRRESLIELFNKQGLKPTTANNWQDFLDSNAPLVITVGQLEIGINAPEEKLLVIAEPELYGQQVFQRRRRKKSADNPENSIKNLTELTIGAPVVHIDHGVGRYQGLQHINAGGSTEEFLTLTYADDATLYVPVSSLDLISRYTGADEDMAPLHKLGSEQWSKAKQKAAEKIRDVAAELLDIYARREARPGNRLKNPISDYESFAAGFPFEETPDQKTAIEAVIADLESPKATDRLVCGDVGFGKTEVAMRAAFVAINNDKQVIVLVPTTLLAQQHYQSFKDRFADWPARIEVLSRFKSAKQQAEIINDVAEGKVDILVGTHKLLNDSISYRNLGLLIIDEEHRFGVRQKEKLKSLRAEVDILTLTATPIPRTLNMAMSGMRDLSIIATPPARRLSVKTFVREFDKAVIKEALLREILRGGQVYYLHNEVKDIERKARELAELAPELRIGIGHGQMPERELEQVMTDFYHKRYNVLLCTTIIETGIDVPSANTIIIDRADKFGLAQLHQLRGRVGRSHHQAYAYLLTPNPKVMTKDAHKRLEAISQSEDLGSGFMLATHDLEIRGAGELLGDDQSGQIHSIGFSLYMEMLERAVTALKNGQSIDLDAPLDHGSEINLRLSALIPDDYLPDVHTRLTLYKRIASARNTDELRELQVEMIDRFGLLPEAVKNLFRVSQLKIDAHRLGIKKIEASSKGGKFEFDEKTHIDPMTLVQLVQTQPMRYKLAGATALRFEESLEEAELRFSFVEELIDKLKPNQ